MGYDVAIIGLGRMGQNLALNLAEKGFSVAVYNRTKERTEELLARAEGLPVKGFEGIRELALELKSPRKVLLMVAPGPPVGEVLSHLERFLEPGDVVADLGNSHFRDTERRAEHARAKGYIFCGVGVSGGPAGARRGLSIMAGGDSEGFERLRPLLEAAAARGPRGPALAYLGAGGAGHYVKMVHNGIEYAMMQVLAELYDVQRRLLAREVEEIRGFLRACANGPAASFLLDTALQVLSYRDEDTRLPLVELIMDKAEQKGTGRWCAQEALELGWPAPMICSAVEARVLSSLKELRELLAPRYKLLTAGPMPQDGEMEQALNFGFLMAYVEGLELLRRAAKAHAYGFRLEHVLLAWHAGSVVRSSLLDELLKLAGELDAKQHALLVPGVERRARAWHEGARKVLSRAKEAALPMPALSSALDHFDALASKTLPANLLQGMRDLFGGHGFERIDRPGVHHGPWAEGQ
ncbi:MAG: phosphogluconate dehydrogenase (NADP(+)-dependent, decarboxylating) [Nitrososphaerota archaeon]